MRVGVSNLRCLLLLLLSPTACVNYASAQLVTQSPVNPDAHYTTLDPSMAIIILVLISTVFVVAMFSIYARHCSDLHAGDSILAPRAFTETLSKNRGLDPSVIESFPVFVYSAVKDLKIGKGSLECAVCLSEFEDDETLRLLPVCDHVFHPNCIDAWLASNVTCPVCRAELTPPESDDTVKTSGSNHGSNQTRNNNNSSSEVSNEERNQIAIDVGDEQSNGDAQVAGVTNGTPVRNGALPRFGILEKFPRSHSTGHSIFQAGANLERYTLRFPEEVRKQLMMRGKLKRTVSFNAVLAREGSSRKGGGGGEGSGRGRADRWVFSMTPPFVSKIGSVKSGGEGEGWNPNGRSRLTAPLRCLNVKLGQGGESSSARPQV